MEKRASQPLVPEGDVCVGVPEPASVFIARKCFKVNRDYDALLPIREIRQNFYHRFLRGHGKKESPIPPNVHLQCLYVPADFRSRNVSLLEALVKLGGEDLAETTLYEVSWAISMQRHLRLLQSFQQRKNYFLVRDIDEVLCGVSLVWFRVGGSLPGSG